MCKTKLALLCLTTGLVLLAGTAGAALLLLARPGPEEVAPLRGLDPRFSVTDLAHSGVVQCVAFSPDGKYLVAGSKAVGNHAALEWQGDLKIWEVASKAEVKSLRFPQWVLTASFSPDGRLLAVACSSKNIAAPPGFMGYVPRPGRVRVYDFPAMREKLDLSFEPHVESAAFSPDGKRLAVVRTLKQDAYGPAQALILDVADPQKRVLIPTKWSALSSVAFSLDGSELLVGDYDERHPNPSDIKVFDAATGEYKFTVGGKVRPGLLQLTPDGTLLSAERQIVTFCDYRTGKVPMDLLYAEVARWVPPSGGACLRGATISPDKRYLLATAGMGRRSRSARVLWEDRQEKEFAVVFHDPSLQVVFSPCALAPGGRTFAVGTDFFRGLGGTEADPMRGHVLLFERRAP